MIQATQCPDASVLGEHLRGALADEAESSVVAHLDHCESCQHKLELLGAGDTQLLHTARRAGKETCMPEPQLRALLGSLTASGKSASGASFTAGAPGSPAADTLPTLGPPQQPGELGRLGHYAILEVIGRGGMGTVFKGFDQRLQRVVAVKVLAPQLAASASARERFLREARAAAAIRHDHVVSIYAVEDSAEPPYLVMEYIPGGSLADRLKQDGPLDLRETLRLGVHVALGLAAAHAAGVIHRDIKPANVLLENGLERAKLSDFGLACAADDAGLAASGVIAGTPQYMAPEQARGEALDQRADLFSLGSLLYCLCSGHEPFQEGDTIAVVRAVQMGRARPLRERNPRVPEWLAALIARLHASKPADRFASANEVAELLSQRLAQLDQPAAPAQRDHHHGGAPVWRMALAGAFLVGVLIVGVVLVGAGALGWPWWSGSTAGERENRPEQRPTLVQVPLVAAPAKIWPPKVLMVLPSKDYFFPDYFTVQTQLSNAGVTCVLAAPTLDEVPPLAGGPTHKPLKPEALVTEVKAADYSAIYFGGGHGIAEYLEGGAYAGAARRLIQEALAARRLVTAQGVGPRVLADAGVLKDVRATCYQFSQPYGFHVKSLQRAGAIYVDEPFVTHGLFVTGRNPNDTMAFIQELRQQLGVR